MGNSSSYIRLFSLSVLNEAPHCLPFLPESAKMGPGVKSNDLTRGVLVLGCFAGQKRKAPNIWNCDNQEVKAIGRVSGRLLYKYVLQREKIKHKTNDRTSDQ